MNANSQQPVLVINSWLDDATSKLAAIGIASARLDAELILAHTIHKGRTYLHAHGNDTLDDRTVEIADARLALRLDYVPIAYIIGHKEFYGRRFSVTTATLIPRPESEDLIATLKSVIPKNIALFDTTHRLVDVGTGSGCLGITAKLELPELDVTLLDISSYALKVAASNAHSLDAEVRILKSDLLKSYPFRAQYIVANLPYVDPAWEISPSIQHEPALALYADNEGKALIFKLIDQSVETLTDQGYLILEADPVQHTAIIDYAKSKRFVLHAIRGYCVSLQKD